MAEGTQGQQMLRAALELMFEEELKGELPRSTRFGYDLFSRVGSNPLVMARAFEDMQQTFEQIKVANRKEREKLEAERKASEKERLAWSTEGILEKIRTYCTSPEAWTANSFAVGHTVIDIIDYYKEKREQGTGNSEEPDGHGPDGVRT